MHFVFISCLALYLLNACSHKQEQEQAWLPQVESKPLPMSKPPNLLKNNPPPPIKEKSLAKESTLRFRIPKTVTELPRSSVYSQPYYFNSRPNSQLSPIHNVTIVHAPD